MSSSPPGFSAHGISQASILEWVVISSSRKSTWPRDRTCVFCIGRLILYRWATREALLTSHLRSLSGEASLVQVSPGSNSLGKCDPRRVSLPLCPYCRCWACHQPASSRRPPGDRCSLVSPGSESLFIMMADKIPKPLKTPSMPYTPCNALSLAPPQRAGCAWRFRSEKWKDAENGTRCVMEVGGEVIPGMRSWQVPESDQIPD